MIETCIGLGSNLGDSRALLKSALAELAALPDSRLVAVSSFYRSAPMVAPGESPDSQPDYLNAVARLDTALAPHALLDALQAIETAHGRRRDGRRWAPRTLDLDLLLYGDQQLDDARLRVPHPGMAERNFVLYPLAEIAPAALVIPGAGRLAGLLEQSSMRGLEKIDT
ncbi:MAG TPA: 2-amino-4-hydroxy-6-hydroxymethyldihydropteridine diphosphokinase [Gammaproteobacteria bacterium]|nr:2-amino-4-hydroxy-6-hydroxymethyldihydropteridine diphosphokinase [Gammaproteobacteria bacterium]